jgi:hypothetical protein
MFQVGDLLILKEMQRNYLKEEDTAGYEAELAEKIMLVTDVKSDPYEHYIIEFCFTKAVGSHKISRTKEFLEQYYEVYKTKT